MSEAAMWAAIRPVIKHLDPCRIESPIVPGIPDVNYTQGWIELKYVAKWPPRMGLLRVDHFTKQQRVWLYNRCRAGGLAWLLLKVGKSEWLLFKGSVAAIVVGWDTQEGLYKACTARWLRLPKTDEICQYLLNKKTQA
jgi:hypothetical protein